MASTNPQNTSAAEPSPYADCAWEEVVERIRAGDASAMEELYRVFENGIRFFLCRRFGAQDLDDKVHDIFMIVVLAIRGGELREPSRLMGYVRTVLHRQVVAHIENNVKTRSKQVRIDKRLFLSDRRPDPERRAIERENMEIAMRVLGSIRKRDREVLTRFYLKEEPAPVICREMGLSLDQFRLIKTRAKNRFGELGKNRVRRNPSA